MVSSHNLIQLALKHHQAGRLAQAETLFHQVLQNEPNNPDALHLLGALARQAGKPAIAADFIKRAINAHPAEPIFHNSLGLVFKDMFKLDEAIASYRVAVSIKPDYIETYYNLGNAFQLQGKLQEAISSYRKALALKPDYSEAYCNLGSALQAQGKLEEAIANYRKAIALKPNHAEAHVNLGNAFHARGLRDEAIASYRAAISIKPNYAKAHSNLGKVLQEQSKFDEAISSYRQAITLKPDVAEMYCNLGGALRGKGMSEDAASSYRQAIALKPDFAEAFAGLGNTLRGQGNLDEALNCFRQAISINPHLAEAYNGLGSALRAQAKLDEATACYRKALSLKPDFIEAHFNLGGTLGTRGLHDEAAAEFRHVLMLDPKYPGIKIGLLEQCMQMCEWQEMEESIREIRQQEPGATSPQDNGPGIFSLLLPGITAEEQKYYIENYAHKNFKPLIPLRQELGLGFTRKQNGKLHLGYLSADFHDHATSRLMAELFELHDRSRFRITAYSYGPDDGSAMRERIRNSFDQFTDIREYSCAQAARTIHADQVDILIDLKGYTMLNRSGILALRPAPIQVNYVGHPGTMGTDFVDYLIADRFIIPPEHFRHYTEKVMWLPDCYQPTDRTRLRPPPPTRVECGLPEEGIIFCCLNQTYKITPEVFDIWCRLLKAAPGSILWLWANNPYAEKNLKQEAERRGVPAGRLVMAPSLEPEKHLARLQCADLFLDTTPVNAHTTCSDALWMGLPVITCAGETFPSRVAGSLLTAIGLPELITYNLEDYFNLALDLARDHQKRAALRDKIKTNRDTSALFDTPRLTRNLEAAYEKMWAEHTGCAAYASGKG